MHFELNVDLDPKNDDAAYELEVMASKVKCDWSWASPENNNSSNNQNSQEVSTQTPNTLADPNSGMVKNIQS